MKAVYMQAFDYTGLINNTICPDGTDFDLNQLCLLISNHPMYYGECSYFEFEVKSYKVFNTIKNIPIYVGVHKEPSMGVLAEDYIVGSVFYRLDNGGNYDIMEKYNATEHSLSHNPKNILTRSPGVTDIIGVAVNSVNNTITIYVEGQPLYYFSPTLFNIGDEINKKSPFYVCMYTSLQADIIGKVNFGRYGVKYLPKGYITVYDAHNKSLCRTDLKGQITITRNDTPVVKEIDSSVNVVDIKDNGDVYLVPINYARVYSNDNLTFSMQNNIGALISSNLPVPTNYDIYTEFYVRDGVCQSDISGIPVFLTFSYDQNSYQSNSIVIPLYHKAHREYQYYEYIRGKRYTYIIDDVFTSVPNVENKIIGVLCNLGKGIIFITVNKVPFFEYRVKRLPIGNTGLYMQLGDNGEFTNQVTGRFNFGNAEKTQPSKNPFKDTMPEGSMSLWHYYNKINFRPVRGLPCINGTLRVGDLLTRHTKILYGEVQVTPNPVGMEKYFVNGINRLMNTYNIISDIEPHDDYCRYQPPDYLNRLISVNNRGYFPDDVFGTADISQYRKVSLFLENCEITVIAEHDIYLDGSLFVKGVVDVDLDGETHIFTEDMKVTPEISGTLETKGMVSRDILGFSFILNDNQSVNAEITGVFLAQNDNYSSVPQPDKSISTTELNGELNVYNDDYTKYPQPDKNLCNFSFTGIITVE